MNLMLKFNLVVLLSLGLLFGLEFALGKNMLQDKDHICSTETCDYHCRDGNTPDLSDNLADNLADIEKDPNYIFIMENLDRISNIGYDECLLEKEKTFINTIESSISDASIPKRVGS